MKKILLTVISLAMAVTLSGCMGVGGNSLEGVSTDDSPDASKIKAADYSNDLEGLEKYLVAMGYIPEKAEPEKMMYTVIGAKDGDRYNFTVDNSAVYVELYEYDTDDLNDDANRVIGEVKKDGKFYVFGETGNEEDAAFEAALSSNGKYLVSYTLSTDGESNVQRKEDFEKAVKNFHNA